AAGPSPPEARRDHRTRHQPARLAQSADGRLASLRAPIVLAQLGVLGEQGGASVVRVGRVALVQERDIGGLKYAVEDAGVRDAARPVVRGAAWPKVSDAHLPRGRRGPRREIADLASLRGIDEDG